MKKPIAVLSLLVLSACANSAENYYSKVTTTEDREVEAFHEARRVGAVECANGKVLKDMSKTEAAKVSTCQNGLYRKYMGAVTMFPNEFESFMGDMEAASRDYTAGKTGLAQYTQAREDALAKYVQAKKVSASGQMQTHVREDEITRQQMQAMANQMSDIGKENAQRQRDAMPTYSTCNVYGNTAHCVSQKY